MKPIRVAQTSISTEISTELVAPALCTQGVQYASLQFAPRSPAINGRETMARKSHPPVCGSLSGICCLKHRWNPYRSATATPFQTANQIYVPDCQNSRPLLKLEKQGIRSKYATRTLRVNTTIESRRRQLWNSVKPVSFLPKRRESGGFICRLPWQLLNFLLRFPAEFVEFGPSGRTAEADTEHGFASCIIQNLSGFNRVCSISVSPVSGCLPVSFRGGQARSAVI